MTRQRFETTWRGIPLVVGYEPEFFGGHVEIHVPDRQPLSVTETGYRSLFTPAEEVGAAGGPVEYVLALLDLAADEGAAAAMRHRFAPSPPQPATLGHHVAAPGRPEPEDGQKSLFLREST